MSPPPKLSPKSFLLLHFRLLSAFFLISKSFIASTFVTLPKPFLTKPNSPSLSNRRLIPGLQRNSLRVCAVSKQLEPTKVVAQADRVLVRLEQLPEKSAGGVLLPKSSVKFKRYSMGEILSVGPEVGGVKAGTKVLFSDINAYEVDLGTDTKHCFCKESDLLAVVK